MLIKSELRCLVLLGIGLAIYSNLNLFLHLITGVSTLLDLASRSNPNDSIVNSFNYFWTSFTYLPTFFFTYLYIFVLLYTLNHSSTWALLTFPLFILYNYELLDFLAINAHWYVRDGSLSGINLLLSNNLNKYHPFIFYISVFLLVPLACTASCLFTRESRFTRNTLVKLGTVLQFLILLINLLALFLGSWWALQEGTWGGWWNWDASEVLGLLVSLLSLQSLHLKQVITNLTQFTEKFLIGLWIFVFSYFFIQLNFDLVSHNFGSKFFFFFNNNLFFLEILALVSTILLIHLGRIYFWRTQLYIILANGTSPALLSLQWFGVWLIILLITTTAFSSFLPLLNYFLWSYFAINSFNFHIHLPLIILLFFVIFFVTFLSFEFFGLTLFLSLPLCYYVPGACTPLLLLPIRKSFISLQHVGLLILLVLNCISYNLNFVYWYPTMFYEEIPLATRASFIKQDLMFCDMVFIDKLILYQSGVDYWNTSTWTTMYGTNAPTLNSFLLAYDAGTHYNYYSLIDGWLSPALYIETGYLNNLLDTSFVLIVCVLLLLLTSRSYLLY